MCTISETHNFFHFLFYHYQTNSLSYQYCIQLHSKIEENLPKDYKDITKIWTGFTGIYQFPCAFGETSNKTMSSFIVVFIVITLYVLGYVSLGTSHMFIYYIIFFNSIFPFSFANGLKSGNIRMNKIGWVLYI